jgi:hypothetical protein
MSTHVLKDAVTIFIKISLPFPAAFGFCNDYLVHEQL